MVEKLETDHLDLLCGWRKNRQDTLDRTLPSRLANWLIGCVSGVALHDYGCSLKVGRRDVLEGLDLRGEMHRFIPCGLLTLLTQAGSQKSLSTIALGLPAPRNMGFQDSSSAS